MKDHWFLGGVCIAVVAACSLVPPPRCRAEDKGNGPTPDASKLVRELGDDDFEVREAATRRLKRMPEALPAIRRATKSSDAEVARRAADLLEFFAPLCDKMARARLAAFIKGGEIDRAIDLFGRQPPWEDEAVGWQPLFAWADNLTVLVGKESEKARPRFVPASFDTANFRSFVQKHSLQVVTTRCIEWDPKDPRLSSAYYAARGEDLLIKHPLSHGSLYLAAGDVTANALSGNSVFSGGDVKAEVICSSLIIAGGEVTVCNLDGTLVIARGRVRVRSSTGSNMIVSSATLPKPDHVADWGYQAREKQAEPFGVIKWFDPAKLGITAEPAGEGAVRVKEVAAGKPFAAAGLRAGDIILDLDGEAVKSVESFRRLLRSRTLDDEDILFHVRRDKKPLELLVRYRF